MFRLVANDYHTRVPSTLLQVNVILVSTSVLDKYSSHAHLICAGFDLTPCQVVVAVDARREYTCTRLEAVSSRSPSLGWLELTPCAFTMAHKDVVCVQMRRVMKYIDRGFRFSCREPHDGDVLVEILQSRPINFLGMPGAEWPDVMARRNALGNNAPDERERNAPGGETWDADSSESGSAATNDNHFMRSLRVKHAFVCDSTFDYWVDCQMGESAATDPIRLRLAAPQDGTFSGPRAEERVPLSERSDCFS